jgi:hypothetical protein
MTTGLLWSKVCEQPVTQISAFGQTCIINCVFLYAVWSDSFWTEFISLYKQN